MDVTARLHALRERLDRDRATDIGFPGAVDFDYTPLLPFFGYLLNNVGDPFVDGTGRAHTKDFERQVVSIVADLLGAAPGDRWGYVTSGGTEGNEYGLHLARSLYPDAVVYFSEAAHYSVPKTTERLRMPAIAVRASPLGELDYEDLRSVVRDNRHRPAIVVATVGTTMTEAVDDVATIQCVLRELAIRGRYVHADAALAGLPLALVDRAQRPGFDLADGADSIAVSGHKFIGSPFPCGLVITRRSLRDRVGRDVDYIGGLDSTIGGSRSGHAALLLWYALASHGIDGLRRRAEGARELAAYAVGRLVDAGVPAWRHPHAFTVVLPTPAPAVARRWTMASANGLSHIICMPGVTRQQVDDFVADVIAASPMRAATSPAGSVPAGEGRVSRRS